MSNSISSSSRRSSHQQHHHTHSYNYPSFSSSLLEEIYRSFDEERENRSSDNISYRMMMMKKSNSTHVEREIHHHRFLVDQWIENEKLNLRRKSPTTTANSEGKFRRQMNSMSSSTSSSDSSSGIGGFSSSDTESLYGSSAKPKSKPPPLLKPIRTAVNPSELHRKSYSDEDLASKKKKSSSKKEGNLHRRALKLYGDLKKVKQPISPGGKLHSFLNSIFNSGASKKPKIERPSMSSQSQSNGLKLERETIASTTTPSTASARSCLSKTPSSAGGRFERRSVRFVDVEERENTNRKQGEVAKRDSSMLASDEEFKIQLMEKHRRVEEVAKELLKNYHQRKELITVKNNIVGENRKFENNIIRVFENDVEEDDEDDDDGSCCSSDLFELENFLEIGVDRYREELPVYETTHVGTNRAIANGLIL